MTARRWLALAVVWFALAAVGWGWFFWRRADQHAALVAAQQAWLSAIRQVEAAPAAAPATAPAVVDGARLMAHVRALAFPRATTEARAQARGYIAHTLEDLGWRPALLAFPQGVNVVVEQPGSDQAAGAILLGAHYDTVAGSPGADDNASGVATLLEAARLLREPRPRRTLRLVFFDAEEQGLAGSRAYARSDGRLSDLRAAVVVEMLGVSCRTKGCQRHPEGLPVPAPDVGDFVAVIGDLEHLWLLEAFKGARRPDGPPVFALPVPDKGRPLPDTRRSDHASFWDRGVGAVMVTDTAELRGRHYHLPTDTPETLDPAFLQGGAQLVIDATRALLEKDLPAERPVGNTRRRSPVVMPDPRRGGEDGPVQRNPPPGAAVPAPPAGGAGGGGVGPRGGP